MPETINLMVEREVYTLYKLENAYTLNKQTVAGAAKPVDTERLDLRAAKAARTVDYKWCHHGIRVERSKERRKFS